MPFPNSKNSDEDMDINMIKEDRKKILSVKNLYVYYSAGCKLLKKSGQKAYVKDVSFDVYEGEIIGLVGESGCGKSTLAKAILGVNKNTKGEIIHYSDDPQMIFQDPYGSLNPSKSVGWILKEPLRVQGNISEKEMDEQARNMLKKVGLADVVFKRKPGELSGGQRQRVCIALSLMRNPEFIIADEPVSALDVTVQSQIIKLLIELNREMGIAILFISHDLKVVYEICDRVLVMKDGIIVEQGSDEEIYKSPKEEYTKLLLKSAKLNAMTED